MKKLIILFFICLSSLAIFAQSPQQFSYQAVIRSSTNGLVTNSPIGMRVSILQGSATGTSIYTETHQPHSNVNGLVTILVGGGTVVSGSFNTINWGSSSYFLKTETDVTGGTTYSIVSTTQLLSVPYALYANTAQNVLNNNDSDSDIANEIQVLSLSNDSLFLSKNGGVVKLPTSQVWSLNGNSGTNAATNFIGTTDGTPLVFKVNNGRAGLVDNNLQITSFGLHALNSNISGLNNVAIGSAALGLNTTGNFNIAVGDSSLFKNISTNYNTAQGYRALFNNTGNASTAVGAASLYNNTGGSYNTSVGASTMVSNTNGNANTAIGVDALYANTTGSFNTAVGRMAFYTGAVFNNSTALGNGTVITSSSQIRLGDMTVTSIGGFASWSNISDARFKKNVKENVPGLSFINGLRPVTYNLSMDDIARYYNIPDSMRFKDGERFKESLIQTGFIAQEVEELAKKLGFDFSGVDAPKNSKDSYSLRYSEFTVPLVKAVQELSLENKKLEEQLLLLQQRLEALENTQRTSK